MLPCGRCAKRVVEAIRDKSDRMTTFFMMVSDWVLFVGKYIKNYLKSVIFVTKNKNAF